MLPEVILSANVSHYYYAARFLYQAGILRKYICAVVLKQHHSSIEKLLPTYWRKKVSARCITDIDKQLIYPIWLPELLQRGLPALGLISKKRGDWINDLLYDRIARSKIVPCDIFHTLHSIGHLSSKKARKLGAVIVCDERQVYPDYQLEILREEHQRLGIPTLPSPSDSINRIKTSYDDCDYLILPSVYAKNTFISAGYPAEKIQVLPYGVDLDLFAPLGTELKPDIDNRKIFQIIFTGSIVPIKGVHYLVKAFQELGLPNSELLIIGEVSDLMQTWAQDVKGKNSNIRFLGHIPKIELPYHYQNASVFVLPSLVDSYGLVCLEAMACGLPVIVTQNSGSKEAVQPGINGFVIPIRDVGALKESLLYFYENPEKRDAMGQAALLQVKEFTWEKYGDNLLTIYSQILHQSIPSVVGLNR